MLQSETPSSRHLRLLQITNAYKTGYAALVAGNNYAAVRHPDSDSEVIAAGLCLSGFHGPAAERFAALRPERSYCIFAKAVALLFTEGRHSATAYLSATGCGDEAVLRLRHVLEVGQFRINFLSSTRATLERLHRHRKQAPSLDLDVNLVTCSPTSASDITYDALDTGFVAKLERGCDPATTAHVLYGDSDIFPVGILAGATRSVRIHIDSHHNLARQASELAASDAIVCMSAEAHDNLSRLLGLSAITFHRISDFSEIDTCQAQPPTLDIFFSGGLLLPFSPRREAVVAALVRLGSQFRIRLCDGKLPRAYYAELTACTRMVPALLEDATSIPSPRFHEALAAGSWLLVDDPAFLRAGFPDYANHFIGFDELLADPEAVRRRTSIRPASSAGGTELHPLAQLTHLSLMSLLRPISRPVTRDAMLPRLTCTLLDLGTAERLQDMASPWLMRTLEIATTATDPIGLSDALLQLRQILEISLFLQDGKGMLVWPAGLRRMLQALADDPMSQSRSHCAVRPSLGCTPDPAGDDDHGLLGRALLRVAERATTAFPDNLALAFHRLDLLVHHANDRAAILAEIEQMRAARDRLRYDPWLADVGSPIHQPLSSRVARRISAGQCTSFETLTATATSIVWGLVDQFEAWWLEEQGDLAAACRVLRQSLARDPENYEISEHWGRLWRRSPEAACGSATSEFFCLGLQRAIARSPSKIFELALPLATELARAGDSAAARTCCEQWLLWQRSVERPASPVDQDAPLLRGIASGQTSPSMPIPQLPPPPTSPAAWAARRPRPQIRPSAGQSA